MKLREHCGTLTTVGLGKVIFILDASESAANSQHEILGLARDVLSVLPAGVGRSLYFLGNPEPYPAGELANRGAEWASENRPHASLVTPVFERLQPDAQATVVIIGSGRVFDLEDWIETPIFERTVLVAVGESLQAGQNLAEELIAPSRTELSRRVHDPVVRVVITGPGFMPTLWDNTAYRLLADRGQFSLLCEKAADYAVRLCYFVSGGKSQLTSGALEAAEPAPTEPGGGRLSPEEAAVLRAALEGRPIECPRCHGQHRWDTLRCLKGGTILGELVYPSLQWANASGFVLFQPSGGDICFAVHQCPVLRLEFGKVAIKSGGRAEIHWFDEAAGCWRGTGDVLESYDRVGDDAYAIFL
jgi:hypothetical protein